MTEISAGMVKELRDATSAGMMDAKRALVETGGDFDAAVKLLRERGMASAAKRADRATSEGKVATLVEGRAGALVAVGCETEPVSRSDEFVGFVDALLYEVFEGGDEASGRIDGERAELSGKLGENIQVVGARRMELVDGESFAQYVHPPGKVGVLLRAKGGAPELARLLALQIAFSKPTYTSREDVPADLVSAEREILSRLPEVEGKPEGVREKIVEGMLNKRFYAESVLAEQTWIHDTSQTVAKALAAGGLELVEYAWFSVG